MPRAIHRRVKSQGRNGVGVHYPHLHGFAFGSPHCGERQACAKKLTVKLAGWRVCPQCAPGFCRAGPRVEDRHASHYKATLTQLTDWACPDCGVAKADFETVEV